MELTDNEKYIITFLREARPYESILIKKDAQGKADSYLITREQKIILSKLLTVLDLSK